MNILSIIIDKMNEPSEIMAEQNKAIREFDDFSNSMWKTYPQIQALGVGMDPNHRDPLKIGFIVYSPEPLKDLPSIFHGIPVFWKYEPRGYQKDN